MFFLKIKNRGDLVWVSTDEVNALEEMELTKKDKIFEIKDVHYCDEESPPMAMYGSLFVNDNVSKDQVLNYLSNKLPKMLGVLSDVYCLVFPVHKIKAHECTNIDGNYRVAFSALVTPPAELFDIPRFEFLDENDEHIHVGFFREQSKGSIPTKNILDRDGVLAFSLHDWKGEYRDKDLDRTLAIIDKYQF